MNVSLELNMDNNIIKILTENIQVFDCFEEIYLFGSILNESVIPQDVDLLLVYSKYSNKIIEASKRICSVIEENLCLPVDLTILSLEELKNTWFLKRIIYYLKIK